MSLLRIVLVGCALLVYSTGSLASECKNPTALGTSRVLEVDPFDFPLVGKQQYMETLRLKDREVVLTFDDGPEPGVTDQILKDLAQECVKATFFMIGQQAAEDPKLARQVYDAGHTVGFHTFSHIDVEKAAFDKAKADINLGIAAVRDALGEKRPPAPFYRPPFLSMTKEIERYLISRGMMIWSIDVDSDDWMEGAWPVVLGKSRLTPEMEVLERTLSRLELAGKGIVLMHDIKPVTAKMMPRFLSELKARGFKIVHVVPTKPRADKAASATSN